jgi:hypothetical protein
VANPVNPEKEETVANLLLAAQKDFQVTSFCKNGLHNFLF